MWPGSCGLGVASGHIGGLGALFRRSANMEIFAALLLVTSTFIKAATSLVRLGDCHRLGESRHWPGAHAWKITQKGVVRIFQTL